MQDEEILNFLGINKKEKSDSENIKEKIESITENLKKITNNINRLEELENDSQI